MSIHDPRVVATILIFAIWLTLWVAALVGLRLTGAHAVRPSLALLVPAALAGWIGWVWLR